MNSPSAPVPPIPAHWLTPRASRKPLQLLPAEMFNRTFERAPDDWLHVAPLRRPPVVLIVAAGLVGAGCVWVVWSVLTQAGTTPSMQGPAPYIIAVLFGLFGLYFILTFISALLAVRSRGSWSNRQCIAIGRSGIALRLQGFAVDVPWDELTGVTAMITNNDGRVRGARRANIPVLRIERGIEKWDLASFVLDASPVGTYAAAAFYWRFPAARGELGTTVGQQRIDAYAGVAPTTIAKVQP